MWKFQNITPTQVSREINFGNFEAPKTAIFTILVALIFEFLETLVILNCEILPKIKIQSLQNCSIGCF